MRKPSPTAATNQACDDNCPGDGAIDRAVKRATDDSVDANARHDGRATTDGKQPQLHNRRAALHTGDERCASYMQLQEQRTTTQADHQDELRALGAEHEKSLKVQAAQHEQKASARQSDRVTAHQTSANVARRLSADHEKALADATPTLAAKCAEFRDKYEDAVRGRRVVCPACGDVDEASQWTVFSGPLMEETDLDSDTEVGLGEPPAPPDLVAAAELESERKAYEALKAQVDDAAAHAASNDLRLENKILKLMSTINDLSASVVVLSLDKSALAEAKTKLQEETTNLALRVATLEASLQTQQTQAKSDMKALETRAVTTEAAQEANATAVRELQTTIEGLSTSALFRRTQELMKEIRDLQAQLHRLGH